MSNSIQVNGYGGVNPNAATTSDGTKTLGMTDFLQLLATQMANQDVMNPTDNTEFVAQMAQFSSLQMLQTLNQYVSAQYSASLSNYSAEMVGKNVLLGTTDDKGKYVEVSGVVDSVSFGSGTYSLKVNGKSYDLSAVMEVLNKLPDPATGTGSTTTPPADGKSDSTGSDDSASDDSKTNPPAST